jgi:hypothetical protein
LRTPPICSGSDGVAAAAIPPVRAKVSAFKVISDRITVSRSLPVHVQRFDQSLQKASVADNACSTSNASGGRSCEACHISCKGRRAPFFTSMTAATRPVATVCSNGARRTSAFGPATK